MKNERERNGRVTVDAAVAKRYPFAARISNNLLVRNARSGYSVEQICGVLGITAPTYYKKLRNPGLWTVEDVIRLSALLKIKPEEFVTEDLGNTQKERKKSEWTSA